MSRLVAAVLCGLRAALARWRGGAQEAKRKRTSWFDLPPGTFELPSSPEDAEAWYRTHFRTGWPR